MLTLLLCVERAAHEENSEQRIFQDYNSLMLVYRCLRRKYYELILPLLWMLVIVVAGVDDKIKIKALGSEA